VDRNERPKLRLLGAGLDASRRRRLGFLRSNRAVSRDDVPTPDIMLPGA